jgi:preprotein translocase subunit SecD
MMLFPWLGKLADMAAVNARMTPIRANIVGPSFSATRISASMAACHSGAKRVKQAISIP